MHAFVALLTLASTFIGPSPPAAQVATKTGIRIEIHVEPFQDLWFSARSAGAGLGEVPAGFAPAGALFRALGEELGGALAWWPLEARFATCTSAAEARAACAEIPESFERPGKSPLALRTRALELVDALAGIEADFRTKLWPTDERHVRAAAQELERTLLAKLPDVMRVYGRVLDFDGLDLVIPCWLVARMPEQGAVTHRGAGGKGVCFVSVHGLAGSALGEVVLHEATHALDVAKSGDLFDLLRARLEAAGIARTDKIWRDAPHTLMFCASASSVRKTLDPEHVDHGEKSGYYARVGATAVAVRAAWDEIEAKQLDRAAALELIVAALAPKAPATPKNPR